MRRIKVLVGALMAAFAMSCSNPAKEDTMQDSILKLSETAEFGTVEYTVKKLVIADDDQWYKIGDRKVIFSCTAFLKAGIDLTGFTEDNLRFSPDRKTVTVTVPHAKLLSLNMPANLIQQEFSEITLFRSDFTAEERNYILTKGEAAVRASIPGLGILQDAEDNAREFLVAMFSQLGFEEVNVEFEGEIFQLNSNRR